jgi:hypothetical protein
MLTTALLAAALAALPGPPGPLAQPLPYEIVIDGPPPELVTIRHPEIESITLCPETGGSSSIWDLEFGRGFAEVVGAGQVYQLTYFHEYYQDSGAFVPGQGFTGDRWSVSVAEGTIFVAGMEACICWSLR